MCFIEMWLKVKIQKSSYKIKINVLKNVLLSYNIIL